MMKSFAVGAWGLALGLLSAAPALAATNTIFDYEGSVISTTVTDGVDSFGDFGDPATITFNIVADASDAIPVGFTSGGTVGIRVNGSGFSYNVGFSPEGFNDGFNSSISVDTTRVFFATSSGAFDWPGSVGDTLRTTLLIEFGTALLAAPATYGELISALQAPGSEATFATNGDFIFANGGPVFDEYRVVATPPVAPVPLPAGLWLLLSGYAGLLVLRSGRRRGV